MARVFLLVVDHPELSTLLKKLRAAGHRLAVTEPRYPQFYDLLRQQSPPPEVFVADASKAASHVRESGNYIRSLRPYKDAPFLVYNVRPEDEAKTLERIPGAILVPGDAVPEALERVLRERAAPKPP